MTGIVTQDDADRAVLHRMIDAARLGTLVEMSLEPQIDEQRKMWAMLGEVAKQYEHAGRFYAKEQWKILFLHACGQEVEFAPSLDGSTFIPFEGRSSKMKLRDNAEFISFIEAWGVQNGVVFRDGAQ
jgi:NinB protein